MIDKRITELRKIMAVKNLAGVVITSRENQRYLSDFSGMDSILTLTRDNAYFGTDFRYIEVCQELKKRGYKIVLLENGAKSIVEMFQGIYPQKGLRIGYEGAAPVAYFQNLQKAFDEAVYVDVAEDLLRIRSLKDEGEIEKMQKAASIADMAFTHILKVIKVGMTEMEVAAELEYVMKKNGSSYPSFDTIAISGKKTSMPHGEPSSKIIENHDTVTLDFGANYMGYCSDMTRTFFMGHPIAEMEKIYKIVYRAQKEAQDYIKAGVTGFEADKVARDIITKEGYGSCFGHSTGHGVGLLIHEEPRLSTKSTAVLMSNMAVTVEPGIYVSDLGGVRIENTVIVTETGAIPLNHSNKEMLVI
ncbi:MAG: aminopeptidase P family protein [Clostridia bacterium]|jgi:Xaa-Pro aminopeptidase